MMPVTPGLSFISGIFARFVFVRGPLPLPSIPGRDIAGMGTNIATHHNL
jgi:hypothetical protein